MMFKYLGGNTCKTSHIDLLASGSIPEVGSSSIRIWTVKSQTSTSDIVCPKPQTALWVPWPDEASSSSVFSNSLVIVCVFCTCCSFPFNPDIFPSNVTWSFSFSSLSTQEATTSPPLMSTRLHRPKILVFYAMDHVDVRNAHDFFKKLHHIIWLIPNTVRLVVWWQRYILNFFFSFSEIKCGVI